MLKYTPVHLRARQEATKCGSGSSPATHLYTRACTALTLEPKLFSNLSVMITVPCHNVVSDRGSGVALSRFEPKRDRAGSHEVEDMLGHSNNHMQEGTLYLAV